MATARRRAALRAPAASAIAPASENPSFPFCGERCRLIDLGRWLDEDYRCPRSTTRPASDDDEP